MGGTWHVLQVKSGSEQAVAKLFLAPTYVPVEVQKLFIRKTRKKIERVVPLIPQYVFVLTDDARGSLNASTQQYNGVAEFERVRKAVRGFLRNGDGTFAQLQASDYELLTSIEAEINSTSVKQGRGRKRAIAVGQKVEFTTGRMEGLKGVVSRIHRKAAQVCVGRAGLPVSVAANDLRIIGGLAA